MMMILLFNVPESNVALNPKLPDGIVHCQPVAAPDVVVAIGKLCATYRYLLAPQRFVATGCMVMQAGISGGLSFRFVIFSALVLLLPQLD